ncbi:MAG: hypothetical protein G3M70_02670 [Candidatus Nitronauta litoralis]|uniref:Uncharacterized protein n=1 Tax=Candidatus Nitronauta litoralis TaxID=2705533 RepID=A0A7T0BU07_9BACT|nr:MAG: hypothetical protein G3M70_02670 [Candidatus Nitronauta litoralis]
MFEDIGNFVTNLPPLLQLVVGGVIAVGVLILATKIADWNEGKEGKKK